MVALFIAPERNRLKLVERLMKTLMTSLHHSPVKCPELIEFPNQLTDHLHKEYFALSKKEKCFLLGFLGVDLPTVLGKDGNIDNIISRNPESRPIGTDHQATCEVARSYLPHVKSELSNIFEHCLRSILPRAIIGHTESMCNWCFWRIEENSRLMP